MPETSDITTWLGGIYSAEFLRQFSPGDFYIPDTAVWFELPSERIVGAHTLSSSARRLGASVLSVASFPFFGDPRTPQRIVLSDGRLIREIEASGLDIPIRVGTNHALDAVAPAAVALGLARAELEPTYLSYGGGVAALARLFLSAAPLYEVLARVPVPGPLVLALDVPGLSLSGLRVALRAKVGQEGGAHLTIYRSFVAMQVDTASVSEDLPEHHFFFGSVRPVSPVITLTLVGRDCVGERMLSQVRRHHWSADRGIFPLVVVHGPSGTKTPPKERDLELVCLCAQAVVSWLHDVGDVAARRVDPSPPFPTLAVSTKVSGGHEVLVGPCQDASLRDQQANPRPSLPRWESLMNAEGLLETGDRVHSALISHAIRTDPSHAASILTAWYNPATIHDLASLFLAYHVRYGDTPIYESYEKAIGHQMTPHEREWIDAQARSWVSVWEIGEASSDDAMLVRDLITGEVAEVSDLGQPRFVSGLCILARVVRCGGMVFLSGRHETPLYRSYADRVLRDLASEASLEGGLSRDRLREERWFIALGKRWEDSVFDLLMERQSLPTLTPSEGVERPGHQGMDPD